MSNITEYKDIMAFHPGYYVAEVVEDMGISQAEFAVRMGTTAKTLSTLINGQSVLSNDLAKKLSVMLGTSVEVWLNLQKAYDEKLIEIEVAKDMDEQKDILQQIDYAYFVKVAGLPKVRTSVEKITNLCQYFAVYNLKVLLRPDYLVNYRTSTSKVDTKNLINAQAWIQTAINYANQIETGSFDAEKLKCYLPELRGMTLKSPEEFLPRMRKIFAECGVAFVLLPHLKNSGVNGAVKWISSDRVVLAMNNRGLYADRFWFSLFHEIKHVLQQKMTKVFVSGTEESWADINESLEEEADNFAKNYLIPVTEWKRFAPTENITDEEIIAFSNKIGIHPGIVVGRLQHDEIIPQRRCAKLKEKYEIEVSDR